MSMKIRDLIERLNLEMDLDNLEVDLEAEVESLTIHTKDENKGIKAYIIDETIHKRKDNLETLGYSFEVGF
ncbi:MAG: hypothetical protein PHS04_00660 [Tissierellia bacterium]|nr:hypothetical protein [Tissierellia bacterium]